MKLLYALLIVLLIGADATKPKKKGKKSPAEPVDKPTGVSCSAFAALKIKQVGTGKCTGVAGADCSAVASSQDAFKEVYDTWWSEDGECEKAKLEEAAIAIANVCAAVYVKTIAKVSCTSAGGFACGWAISEGEAYASALARAIAQVAVDASSVDADAFCISDVEAIAGAVAEAAAESQSEACVKGKGSEQDFQNAFVETVASAIAEAFVKATASTCDSKGAAAAQSACFGSAEGKTKGSVKKAATTKASSTGRKSSIEMCPKEMAECCLKSYKRIICHCREGDCMGRWYRKRDYGGELTRLWRTPGAIKNVCQCKLPHT